MLYTLSSSWLLGLPSNHHRHNDGRFLLCTAYCLIDTYKHHWG
jgi:hypothetical protein